MSKKIKIQQALWFTGETGLTDLLSPFINRNPAKKNQPFANDIEYALVKSLLNGADPKDNHNTALHKAVIGQHQEAIQLLLNLGADPLALNSTEQTPWDLALAYGQAELMQDFLPKAHQGPKNDQEVSAHYAAQYRADNEVEQAKQRTLTPSGQQLQPVTTVYSPAANNAQQTATHQQHLHNATHLLAHQIKAMHDNVHDHHSIPATVTLAEHSASSTGRLTQAIQALANALRMLLGQIRPQQASIAQVEAIKAPVANTAQEETHGAIAYISTPIERTIASVSTLPATFPAEPAKEANFDFASAELR